MKWFSLLQHWSVAFSVKSQILALSAGNWVKHHAKTLLGSTTVGAVFLPLAAQATDLTTVATGFDNGVKSFMNLVVDGALLVGLLGIAYGCKLIFDKSNDRENVKNGHIVAALVGGSFLCMIYFIATVLVSTTGGSTSDIGQKVNVM